MMATLSLGLLGEGEEGSSGKSDRNGASLGEASCIGGSRTAVAEIRRDHLPRDDAKAPRHLAAAAVEAVRCRAESSIEHRVALLAT